MWHSFCFQISVDNQYALVINNISLSNFFLGFDSNENISICDVFAEHNANGNILDSKDIIGSMKVGDFLNKYKTYATSFFFEKISFKYGDLFIDFSDEYTVVLKSNYIDNLFFFIQKKINYLYIKEDVLNQFFGNLNNIVFVDLQSDTVITFNTFSEYNLYILNNNL